MTGVPLSPTHDLFKWLSDTETEAQDCIINKWEPSQISASENTTTAATAADITVNQPDFFALEVLDINCWGSIGNIFMIRSQLSFCISSCKIARTNLTIQNTRQQAGFTSKMRIFLIRSSQRRILVKCQPGRSPQLTPVTTHHSFIPTNLGGGQGPGQEFAYSLLPDNWRDSFFLQTWTIAGGENISNWHF